MEQKSLLPHATHLSQLQLLQFKQEIDHNIKPRCPL